MRDQEPKQPLFLFLLHLMNSKWRGRIAFVPAELPPHPCIVCVYGLPYPESSDAFRQGYFIVAHLLTGLFVNEIDSKFVTGLV